MNPKPTLPYEESLQRIQASQINLSPPRISRPASAVGSMLFNKAFVGHW